MCAWSYSQTWTSQLLVLTILSPILFSFVSLFGCITIIAFSSFLFFLANGAFCVCSVCLSLSGLEYICVPVFSWLLYLIRVSIQKDQKVRLRRCLKLVVSRETGEGILCHSLSRRWASDTVELSRKSVELCRNSVEVTKRKKESQ